MMDTTREYIKMCEKATEIQELWGYTDGDYYLVRFTKEDGEQFYGREVNMVLCPFCNVKDGYGDTFINEYCDRKKYIWLPRQDQLQEMVEEIKDKVHFIFRFEQFLHIRYNDNSHQATFIIFVNQLNGTSMEQLWLAFVMKEKYNKIWNGKGWETTKN